MYHNLFYFYFSSYAMNTCASDEKGLSIISLLGNKNKIRTEENNEKKKTPQQNIRLKLS